MTYTVYYKGEVHDAFGWDEAYDLAMNIGPGAIIRQHDKRGRIIDRQRYEDLGVSV